MKLKPLVTETPEGNYQNLHNMTGIDANKEVYLRDFDGKGNLSLVEYCQKECQEKCELTSDTSAEGFGEYMDCAWPIAFLYHMAVGHAELRHRLGQYEATGLSPSEIQKGTCEYSEDDDETWSCSKCPTNWTFTDGGPEDNKVNYCPECGRKVVVWIKHVEDDDEDEELKLC